MPRPIPPYCGLALGITSQEWSQLGLGNDPNVAASSDLNETVDRVTALLLIRIVAWIQPPKKYSDLSTTTICRESLIKSESWPLSITSEVIAQLRTYVKNILSGYNEVPYHNFEHCYHVVISTNKMLDLILHTQDIPQNERPATYGLKDDPLMQFALIFAAVIHDVEHQGIPNRQLANEDDVLAIQYNDTSIAEHRSLFIGFSELLKEDYDLLRETIFPLPADYRRFRKAVVELVLSTDIASPERTQIGKSKWKEAFGDTYETVERKVRKHMEAQRRASAASRTSGAGRGSARMNVPAPAPGKQSRRMSAQSIMSELTLESPYHTTTDGELDDDESVSGSPSESEASRGDGDIEDNGNEDSKQAPVFRPPVSAGGNLGNYIRETSERGKKLAGPPEEDEDEDDGGRPKFVPTHGTSSHDGANVGGEGRARTPPERKSKNRGGGVSRARSMDVSGQFNDLLSVSSRDGPLAGMAMKFHRRLSSISGAAPAFKSRTQRLGLLRTVDLTGESIQTYEGGTSVRQSATGAAVSYTPSKNEPDPVEEIDELREAVVMEVILKAADVAHNLQGWEVSSL